MGKNSLASSIGGLLSSFSSSYFPMVREKEKQAREDQKLAIDREQMNLLNQYRQDQLNEGRETREFNRTTKLAEMQDAYAKDVREWESNKYLFGEEAAGPRPAMPTILSSFGGGRTGVPTAPQGGGFGASQAGPTSLQERTLTDAPQGQAPQQGQQPARKPYANLGDIVYGYESGADPSNVSPDAGGFSYGVNQLNHSQQAGNTSVVPKFVAQNGYSPWFTDAPGTPTFNSQWKAYGQSNPDFGKAQREFAKTEFFQPVAEYAKSKGINVNDPGIQEALLGLGNAHGPQKAMQIIDRVAEVNPQGVTDARQFVGALYAERMKPGDSGNGLAYWKSSSPETQASVKNRLAAEQRDITGLVGTSTGQPGAAPGGPIMTDAEIAARIPTDLRLKNGGQSPTGQGNSKTPFWPSQQAAQPGGAAPTAQDQQIVDIANSGGQQPTGPQYAQGGNKTVTDAGGAPQAGQKDMKWWLKQPPEEFAKLLMLKPKQAAMLEAMYKQANPQDRWEIKEGADGMYRVDKNTGRTVKVEGITPKNDGTQWELKEGGDGQMYRIDKRSGQSEPVQGFKPKPTGGKEKSPEEQTRSLREDFIKGSKSYLDSKSAYNRILTSSKENSATGDMSLVFAYMKMLDPGSTVREGEFAMAENARGVPESITAMYNKILKGERLTMEQRKSFAEQAGLIYKRDRASHDQHVNNYKGFAGHFGYDPAGIVQDYTSDIDAFMNQPQTASSHGQGGSTGYQFDAQGNMVQ